MSESTKQNHIDAINQRFNLNLPYYLFSVEERSDLEKNGSWYQGLDDGVLSPLTADQQHFVDVAHGNASATSEHELNWLKFKDQNIRWGDFYGVITRANSEEKAVLAKILKSHDSTPNSISSQFTYLGRNKISSFLTNDSETSYLEIVNKALNNLNVSTEQKSIKQAEILLAQKVLEQVLEKMSPEQKKQFEEEIIKMAKQETGTTLKAGTAIAAMTAAQVSGFGVYLLATSALSTLSGIIGITLPFAAYTTLSSALSVIIGPVGWLALGGYLVNKFVQPDYKKIIPAITYMAWLREKQEMSLTTKT